MPYLHRCHRWRSFMPKIPRFTIFSPPICHMHKWHALFKFMPPVVHAIYAQNSTHFLHSYWIQPYFPSSLPGPKTNVLGRKWTNWIWGAHIFCDLVLLNLPRIKSRIIFFRNFCIQFEPMEKICGVEMIYYWAQFFSRIWYVVVCAYISCFVVVSLWINVEIHHDFFPCSDFLFFCCCHVKSGYYFLFWNWLSECLRVNSYHVWGEANWMKLWGWWWRRSCFLGRIS